MGVEAVKTIYASKDFYMLNRIFKYLVKILAEKMKSK